MGSPSVPFPNPTSVPSFLFVLLWFVLGDDGGDAGGFHHVLPDDRVGEIGGGGGEEPHGGHLVEADAEPDQVDGGVDHLGGRRFDVEVPEDLVDGEQRGDRGQYRGGRRVDREDVEGGPAHVHHEGVHRHLRPGFRRDRHRLLFPAGDEDRLARAAGGSGRGGRGASGRVRPFPGRLPEPAVTDRRGAPRQGDVPLVALPQGEVHRELVPARKDSEPKQQNERTKRRTEQSLSNDNRH